jgi:hypothetical protein
MDAADIIRWLPALIALGSAIAVIATVRSQAGFSAWRHEQHDRRLDTLEATSAQHSTHIAVLQAGTKDPQ